MDPVSAAAATSATNQAVPGFFLLAWGLLASPIGWAFATDYHGVVEKFTQRSYASTAWLRRIPPWRWLPDYDEQDLADRAKVTRLLGIPFAVIGPIVTVGGVVEILRGHIAVPRGPALPLPVALAFIGVAVVAVVGYWRPRGFFRLAARQGGWPRAAAVITSVGAVSFGVFNALGYLTLGIAGWLVGGLAGFSLLLSGASAADGPRPTGGHDRESEPSAR